MRGERLEMRNFSEFFLEDSGKILTFATVKNKRE